MPPAPVSDLEVQAGVGELTLCGTDEPSKKTAHSGCSRLHIARPFEKSQLTIAWRNDRHSGAGLFVHMSAHDLGEHRVVLRISDSATHHTILEANWPSSESGIISKSITAIVPVVTRKLCVAASTTLLTPSCSAPEGSGTAFVRELTPRP